MTKTTVVNARWAKFDTYIGRPSIWGNPFVIGRDGTRQEVIEKYRKYLKKNKKLMRLLPTLRGKVLGCWCHPSACHGDVLVEMVDSPKRR
jgi:hypothetical protein